MLLASEHTKSRPRIRSTIWSTGAVVFAWLASCQIASADFQVALYNYKAGNFSEAAAEFTALAGLGDHASQFNLGAMAVRGEGREKDAGIGVGWMLAAAENGNTQLTPEKLASFKAGLTPEQAAAADKIVAQYGSKAMRDNVLPGRVLMGNCETFQMAGHAQFAKPYYPPIARRDGQDGIVVIEFTIGTDGLASDPQIVAAAPVGTFDDATVDAILKSRFRPAKRNGANAEFRTSTRLTYAMEDGGTLWKLSAVKKMREAAAQDNPSAKYVIGLLGTLDPTLDIPEEKAREMIISAAQFGNPPAQYWVAQQLKTEQLCGNVDKKERWLHQAAKGGDAGAQIEWVRLRTAAQLDDAEIAELKGFLKAAIVKDNAYALKHAAAIYALPVNAQVGTQFTDKALALSTAKRLKKYDNNLDPQVNEVIAAAFAANEDFKEAVKQQERAIEKAEDLYWNTEYMEARLTAYRESRLPTGNLLAVPPTTKPLPPVGAELADCKKRNGCSRKPDQKRTPTGSFIAE